MKKIDQSFIKLEPCPFCGSPGQIFVSDQSAYPGGKSYSVGCSGTVRKGLCKGSPAWGGKDADEEILLWNERPKQGRMGNEIDLLQAELDRVRAVSTSEIGILKLTYGILEKSYAECVSQRQDFRNALRERNVEIEALKMTIASLRSAEGELG